MSDEKKEPWLNYLALATVILAVCATLSTFKGGGFSTRSVMAQSEAANQWSYFQAKSIKGNLYEVGREKLAFELKLLGPKASKEVVADYQKTMDDYAQRVARYEKEKAEIKRAAEEKEQVRDQNQKHGGQFGLAVIFLQIAILLSSIAALLKQKHIWLLGLAVGAVGMVYFVNGFYLFF
jgi:hypothetical protein